MFLNCSVDLSLVSGFAVKNPGGADCIILRCVEYRNTITAIFVNSSKCLLHHIKEVTVRYHALVKQVGDAVVYFNTGLRLEFAPLLYVFNKIDRPCLLTAAVLGGTITIVILNKNQRVGSVDILIVFFDIDLCGIVFLANILRNYLIEMLFVRFNCINKSFTCKLIYVKAKVSAIFY